MSDSIHKQIIAQLESVLTPLKTAGTVRELAVRNSAAHGAKALPALHIVPGDEQRLAEDTQGLTLERAYLFKLVFGQVRAPFDKAADLVQAVQEAIETDGQLNGLAVSITYQGEQPWISDDTEAVEGTFLLYQVQYRRRRAAASSGY